MTDPDPAMSLFNDLAVPGKRPPVNRGAPSAPTDTAEEALWDTKPLRYRFGGGEREFFTISSLARALGKSVVTIRSWENKGLMPRTPYRSPTPKGRTLPGTPPKGKRLWTREQISGVLAIAKEEGILDGKPPSTTFHNRVVALYTQLREQDQQQ